MSEKIIDAINFYKNKLDRKGRVLKAYADRIAKGEELTSKEMEERNIITAEIGLIVGFIDELEHLK